MDEPMLGGKSAVRLTQEQIDLTASHLADSEITDVPVAQTLKALLDSEDGANELPDDWRPYCHKCNEKIEDGEMCGTAYASFYHDACVPDLYHGPMPLGQLLAGAEGMGGRS